MKRVTILSICYMLSACSSMAGKQLLGNAAADLANTKIGYGKQCFAVKSQCVQGQYEAWHTSDGVEGCSCKQL
ncbi:hypothetical protein [Aliiglaciecola sp. LCG003]|uniref:hypothetical protein n=1 Tax=Aliiglaciecola sp. LCG003 TaxID=3053655 RepID=UPI0025728804|nr:hypothetical protein [Aliiglaciecola sp. LCG003]WJG10178.1 hypothetical protein QR722_03860 [Aliiglaciecola sp. LCG003]